MSSCREGSTDDTGRDCGNQKGWPKRLHAGRTAARLFTVGIETCHTICIWQSPMSHEDQFCPARHCQCVPHKRETAPERVNESDAGLSPAFQCSGMLFSIILIQAPTNTENLPTLYSSSGPSPSRALGVSSRLHALRMGNCNCCSANEDPSLASSSGCNSKTVRHPD